MARTVGHDRQYRPSNDALYGLNQERDEPLSHHTGRAGEKDSCHGFSPYFGFEGYASPSSS